jgi:hypothetical protein
MAEWDVLGSPSALTSATFTLRFDSWVKIPAPGKKSERIWVFYSFTPNAKRYK